MSEIPQDVIRHYEATNEQARLQRSTHRLEAARMARLFDRFLPKPPAIVLDVGGGAGAHAFDLALRGHHVHLLDVTPLHIEQALTHTNATMLASAQIGDARKLPFEDAIADVVLLLGPLYHLTERADRIAAFAEARRALKPGGLLMASSCNRFATALQGVFRDLNSDPVFAEMANEDVATGQHRTPSNRAYFTTAYFHHPDELVEEARDGGLTPQHLIGIEGPGWLLQDFDAAWTDNRRRADLLRLAELLESEPTMLGISTHILLIARA